jgi:membrane glycosyltransferase
VPFGDALRKLWPQTLLGWASIGLLAATVPAAIPYALLIAGGLALAVPFAVVTAYAPAGHALVRLGIGRLPEETSPELLRPLALPALEALAPQASLGAAQASECSKA